MMTTTLSRTQLGPTRKLSRVSSQVSATLVGSKERGYLGREAQQLNTMRVAKHELIIYDRAHLNNNTVHVASRLTHIYIRKPFAP